MGNVLHEVLLQRRHEVMQRWQAIVQGSITPASMAGAELIDHLPSFLDEIIAALREDAGFSTVVPTPQESETASSHGEQRLRLGFSLDAVVREYGALRDAIVATAADAGMVVTFGELQSVFKSTITGIARAVSEYARQRDAELQRQHNEHIAFGCGSFPPNEDGNNIDRLRRDLHPVETASWNASQTSSTDVSTRNGLAERSVAEALRLDGAELPSHAFAIAFSARKLLES